ncbi:MAG: SulP family inorganic anion transporter [Myxococcales bacterium]|nr:SulP family inorganic anion transporter [Myxococcales bacterium]
MASGGEQRVRSESEHFKVPPPDGVAGLVKHWRDDLLSGFLVFLIALPLSLGIAMASGFPPMAGLITAIVGGVLATFFGSAPLTIKGPAAGLIVIAIGAVQELGGGAVGYRRALAAIVVAGALQVGLSLLRAGVLGDTFPSSVIHGMMAAIGVIIISKQGHTLLGAAPSPGEPLHLLAQLPKSALNLNPEVAAIGAASLLILWAWPRLPSKVLHRIPAPLVVVATGIGLARAFDLSHAHHYMIAGHDYTVGPRALVPIETSIFGAMTTPDWSRVTTGVSLRYIAMFALVGSIESMLSAKAVDLLDPWHRRASLDRDLFATGVGNIIAGMLGGLPMISEIVRSSANVASGARTRWSNFFHGALLLAFVAVVPWLLRAIPLAALAALLVFTGVRLASPSEFAKTFRIGREQLVIFVVTMVVTLATDLLVGVAAGLVTKVIVHVLGGMPIRNVFSPSIAVSRDSDRVVVRVGHAAVFSNYLAIRRALDALANEPRVTVDFHDARIVDHTVLEGLHLLADEWERDGRKLEIGGLDGHTRSSAHPLAIAWRKSTPQQS